MTTTPEPVDTKKLLDVSPTTLVKTTSSTLKGLMVILGVVVILFCIYFTIKSLFKPKPTQNVVVQAGGKLDIHNEAIKRAWWIPTPFVEIYGYKDDKAGIGIKGGARWDL